MNLDVLQKLNIVEMSEEYYKQTGFVAEFVYSDFDFRVFIESVYNIGEYIFGGITFGYNPLEFGMCLKNIQDITIKWYNSLEIIENDLFKFEDVILTQEKVIEIQKNLLSSSEGLGLDVLDELGEIKGVGNGKKQ